MKTYADYVYEIVSANTKGFDSVYERFIIDLVELTGLTELRINNLIETCGVINGDQSCVLRDKHA